MTRQTMRSVLWNHDARIGAMIGGIAGVVALPTMAYLGFLSNEVVVVGVVVGVPCLAWFGAVMGNVLGARIPFFVQFSKFIIVGGLSTLIELSILNILFYITGITSGPGYAVFKAVTFAAALANSYVWNRYWSFASARADILNEFSLFFVINIVGVIINVSTASFVVNIVGAPRGVGDVVWGNVGALVAVGITMMWNFMMYRFVVFRSHE